MVVTRAIFISSGNIYWVKKLLSICHISSIIKLKALLIAFIEISSYVAWTFISLQGKNVFLNSSSASPFHATDLFHYPLKTSENERFYDVFRGY